MQHRINAVLLVAACAWEYLIVHVSLDAAELGASGINLTGSGCLRFHALAHASRCASACSVAAILHAVAPALRSVRLSSTGQSKAWAVRGPGQSPLQELSVCMAHFAAACRFAQGCERLGRQRQELDAGSAWGNAFAGADQRAGAAAKQQSSVLAVRRHRRPRCCRCSSLRIEVCAT